MNPHLDNRMSLVNERDNHHLSCRQLDSKDQTIIVSQEKLVFVEDGLP